MMQDVTTIRTGLWSVPARDETTTNHLSGLRAHPASQASPCQPTSQPAMVDNSRSCELAGLAVGAQIRKSVRQGMRDIIQRVGVTSILVTHDQDEAFDIADQVVIFNRCALLLPCSFMPPLSPTNRHHEDQICPDVLLLCPHGDMQELL